MTITAAELLGWDDIARRDLPWRNPGITAWQILVKRVHAGADSGGALAHTIGHGRHERGRRAADPGQAGLTLACSVAITVSHSCSRSNAGHTDAAARTAQITTLGYRGTDKTVRRYRQPFCETLTAPPPVPIAPPPCGRSPAG